MKASETSKETLAAIYRPDKITMAGSSKKVDVNTPEKGSTVGAGSSKNMLGLASSKNILNKIEEGQELVPSSSKEGGI